MGTSHLTDLRSPPTRPGVQLLGERENREYRDSLGTMSQFNKTFQPGERLIENGALHEGEATLLSVLIDGLEDEIILVRTEGGHLAYINRCRHISVPLDYGDGEVFDETGKLFQCRTHGALYRIEDGRCVAGPCSGASLKPVEIVEKEDGVYLSEVG